MISFCEEKAITSGSGDGNYGAFFDGVVFLLLITVSKDKFRSKSGSRTTHGWQDDRVTHGVYRRSFFNV